MENFVKSIIEKCETPHDTIFERLSLIKEEIRKFYESENLVGKKTFDELAEEKELLISIIFKVEDYLNYRLKQFHNNYSEQVKLANDYTPKSLKKTIIIFSEKDCLIFKKWI